MECGLKEIPPDFYSFPKITKLNLQQNKIAQLNDSGFEEKILPHLRELNLSNNYIEKLSDEFYLHGDSIQNLDISNNQIVEISSLVSHMKNLRSFFIRGNCFGSLPKEICRLDLKEFELDWFSYLNPPMPSLIKDEDEIDRILGKLKNCESAKIKIEVFLRSLSQDMSHLEHTDDLVDYLDKAICKSDLGMVKFFSKIKPKILGRKNSKGLDAYNLALNQGNIKAFTVLMNISDKFPLCKVRQELIIKDSDLFGSSLHLAVQCGNLKIIKYLIYEIQIDLEARDLHGNSILHIALMRAKEPNIEKYHKVIEVLLDLQ